MVAAFAGIFQILVKMWGGHSLSGGPGSRGELATASSQSGAQSSLLREGIVNLLGERRRRHKLRTGVGSALQKDSRERAPKAPWKNGYLSIQSDAQR